MDKAVDWLMIIMTVHLMTHLSSITPAIPLPPQLTHMRSPRTRLPLNLCQKVFFFKIQLYSAVTTNDRLAQNSTLPPETHAGNRPIHVV